MVNLGETVFSLYLLLIYKPLLGDWNTYTGSFFSFLQITFLSHASVQRFRMLIPKLARK